jgi:hypothetical protein
MTEWMLFGRGRAPGASRARVLDWIDRPRRYLRDALRRKAG